jgi:hypothetical protein
VPRRAVEQRTPRERYDKRVPLHILMAGVTVLHLELESQQRHGCPSDPECQMLLRCFALLFGAIALAGCCMSGNGCQAPVAAGAPAAWDGLGSDPADDGPGDYKPRRRASPKNEIIVGPLNGQVAHPETQSQAKDWDQQQAIDQQADAKLNSQLKICHGC